MNEKANQIRQTTKTLGWGFIEQMIEEMAHDAERALSHIMSSEPERLVEASALKLAIRAKALRDVLEAVDDEARKADNPNGL